MNLILESRHILLVSPRHKDPDSIVAALQPVIQKYQIDQTPERLGMFLAQIGHESDFVCQSENLNYSAQRLCQVWPRRFPTIESARPYANNAQALANKVYNGRMGNEIGSNQGFLYRGRGLLQLTGRAAYAAYGQRIGVDLVGSPNLALQLPVACLIAGAFWADRGLNARADAGNMTAVTQAINGGQNGADDRLARYRRVIGTLREQAAALAPQEELVHPPVLAARLFVNGVEVALSAASIQGETLTLPSGQHRISKRTQVADKLYVTTA